MRFRFASKDLAAMYDAEVGARRYPAEAVAGFFEAMAVIAAASDERALRSLKSFRYKKLDGSRGRRGDRSLRLNAQWRLIVSSRLDSSGRYLLIHAIEDYHG